MATTSAAYREGVRQALEGNGLSYSGPDTAEFLAGAKAGQERRALRLAGERARLYAYNVAAGRPTEDA